MFYPQTSEKICFFLVEQLGLSQPVSPNHSVALLDDLRRPSPLQRENRFAQVQMGTLLDDVLVAEVPF